MLNYQGKPVRVPTEIDLSWLPDADKNKPSDFGWAETSILLKNLNLLSTWTDKTDAVIPVWSHHQLTALLGLYGGREVDQLHQIRYFGHVVAPVLQNLNRYQTTLLTNIALERMLSSPRLSLVLLNYDRKVLTANPSGHKDMRFLVWGDNEKHRQSSLTPDFPEQIVLPRDEEFATTVVEKKKMTAIASLVSSRKLPLATPLIEVQLLREVETESKQKHLALEQLSEGETEVLSWIVLGLSNKEIAEKRGNRSISTIMHQVSSVLAKTHCETRKELIVAFFQQKSAERAMMTK